MTTDLARKLTEAEDAAAAEEWVAAVDLEEAPEVVDEAEEVLGAVVGREDKLIFDSVLFEGKNVSMDVTRMLCRGNLETKYYETRWISSER